MKKFLFASMMSLSLFAFGGLASGQDLLIDFNSTTQDGGPHNHPGFQAYDAGHEVAADFVTQTYTALGTTVSVTPEWTNTNDNRVQQMLDRGPANDATWMDTANLPTNIGIDGVTDLIGTDTRVANGGNGDWDGTTGTPTYMTLALGGLNAGTYDWVSFHHDTENVHGAFSVELSTDGGTTFAQLADGYMSDGTVGGNTNSLTDGSPQTAEITTTAEMAAIGSIYNTSFAADGANDVVFRFAPYSGVLTDPVTGVTGVHNQIWGMNGFSVSAAAVPEPGSATLLGLATLGFFGFRRRTV